MRRLPILLLVFLPACGERETEMEPPAAPPGVTAPAAPAGVSLAEGERRIEAIQKSLREKAEQALSDFGWQATHPPEAKVHHATHAPTRSWVRARLEFSGTSSEGIGTRIGEITAQFEVRADGSIVVAGPADEIRAALHTSPGAWFEDRTDFAAGELPAFRHHLARGLNHWLPRIEAAYGMDAFIRNGMALGDADGDGRDDLYVCQPGGLPNRLLLHRSDGTLVEAPDTVTRILDHTSAALFIDLDNDGDQDLALATPAGIALLENEGRARFAERGVLRTDNSDCHALSAADYNLDGNLDLYITFALGDEVPGLELGDFRFHDAHDGGGNQLFRGDGDWSFSEVTNTSGLGEGNDRHSLAAGWCDFDLDGDPDLYVANDYGPNQLFRNRDGKFSEEAAALGVEDRGAGMSVSWGDFDRDGRPDLYVGNMFSNAGRRITGLEGFAVNEALRSVYRRFAKGNTLFRQREDGRFEELEGVAEMGRWAWSSVFADLDNDGWEDLFVANGYITGPVPDDL